MKGKRTGNDAQPGVLSRIAFYIVILGWIIPIFYVFSIGEGSREILGYFLSDDGATIKSRAAILFVPLVLTLLGYLINDRAKLFRKTLSAENELRRRTIELERVNELLVLENSERQKTEDLLIYRAFHDSLTNLPNRALFIDRLNSSLERKKRYPGYSFAILFLDLDHFKVINDSLGHIVGDKLLIMLAQRLKKHIRAIDTIARFGGDEFAVLLEETEETSDVKDVAERLQNEMRSSFSILGREIFMTVSIGIVISHMGNYTMPEELLRDADTAMYRAKERGRACHVIFDPTMSVKVSTAFRSENNLRKT